MQKDQNSGAPGKAKDSGVVSGSSEAPIEKKSDNKGVAVENVEAGGDQHDSHHDEELHAPD